MMLQAEEAQHNMSQLDFKAAVEDVAGAAKKMKEEVRRRTSMVPYGMLIYAISILRLTLNCYIDPPSSFLLQGSAKVGTIGFCMGGALSLASGCSAPDVIDASVGFYGASNTKEAQI